MSETLPPRTTRNGKHDAYCHVCWNPVYLSLQWGDDHTPDNARCPFGAAVAHECSDAMDRAEALGEVLKAIAEQKAQRISSAPKEKTA